MTQFKGSIYAGIILVLSACNKPVQVTNNNLVIDVNAHMETRVLSQAPGTAPMMADFTASEYLVCKKFEAKEFTVSSSSSEQFSDKRGSGTRTTITGKFEKDGYAINKILEISVYDSFPDMAVFQLHYVNTGQKDMEVVKWINHAYPVIGNGDTPSFWSFQGSSTSSRKDWMLPVDSSFYQKNYMGMNNTDCGGGVPLVDLWRKDAGIVIGHTELIPRMVSLPVEKDKYDPFATIGIEYEYPGALDFQCGDTIKTFSTFVAVHTGDCFASLNKYSAFMQASGIRLAPVEPDAYKAVWCAWGYERKFTVQEVVGTLPKVKELGFTWVDIDDGYQQAEGDWDVDPSKFPNGSAGMRKMVDQIHRMGLKAKLWWAPMGADPGSKLLRENPDLMLLNEDYAPQFITWWDSYYMSPVYGKTIDHTKGVLKMFFEDWDFDGLKIDGSFLNCVPADYNDEHGLDYPEQACENLPHFFEMIYKTATAYKPHAVVQICPCGMCMTYFLMPWTNQTVASDPTSSWQTRLKGKTYKALLGKTAYYADHVELSDGGNDFPTQIGIGAVLGTKFTWPKDNPYSREGNFLLTPEKEEYWKKWINIYNRLMLPEGDYLGDLYDIGFDKPEAHVIRKADNLYYAFYGEKWSGPIELRGPDQKSYRIRDYVNDVDYGVVTMPADTIMADFSGSLLLEAVPEP